MDFSKLVELRRSVRAYEECEISKEEILKIVECLQLAPSWKNSQTGRYYIALSEKARETVFDCLPEFNQKSSKNAYYVIASFKKGISGAEGEEKDLWGAYDLGLANAYLTLKASDLGYDTLIMGLRDTEKLRECFNIPEDEIILPVIALGKKNQERVFRPRKNVEEILTIK